MNKRQKIEQFAAREFERNKNFLILPDEAGGVIAFGYYYIRPVGQTFEVFSYSQDRIGVFSNKRTAISWCIADKNNRLNLAAEIKNLDCKKQQLSDHITARNAVGSSKKTAEFKEIVQTKLAPKIAQYNSICAELEKCVNSAKYLQLKGFQNETERSHAS